jgi:hypothetical protein
VHRVVCEAKHMGSRAVALVRRDGARWGGGALYTRTGRAFFPDPELNTAVQDRLRGAAEASGLYADLDSDWVLLDTELLPWSAKALDLVKDQFASVAAAARAGLSATVAVLAAAASRGLPVAELRDRTAARLDRAELFAQTYRRYCWPTEGLAGVRVAPFAVLASGGARGAGRGRHHLAEDRGWHLDRADALATADGSGFIARTDRLVVDLTEDADAAQAVLWWLDLTAAGGEGMVVKPFNGVGASQGRQARGADHPEPQRSAVGATQDGRLVQPGIKCRGREYLRIIYGPDYTEPDILARLRQRSLHRKRALALREHALGLAALDRVAAGEPLWRVHEAVFAILACESEPVDPRL